MSIVHENEDLETFWINDPGFTFTIDWSSGLVSVPEGREITDRDLEKMREKVGRHVGRNNLTTKSLAERSGPSEPSLEKALDHLYNILTDKAAEAEAKAEEDGGHDYTQWCESKAREAAFNEAAEEVDKWRNEV